MQRLLLGCVSMLVIMGLLQAADPAGTQPPEPLEPWIEKLGHSDYRSRKSASDFLESQGNRAVDVLTKALPKQSPEVQRRIMRLAEQIETKHLLSPTLISLDLKDVTVFEAMEEIRRQTGYPIEVPLRQTRCVTIQDSKIPFWEAMNQISSQSGYVLAAERGLRFSMSFADSISPITQTAGPFRIIADKLSLHRETKLRNLAIPSVSVQPVQESLKFDFTIQSEPKSLMISFGKPIVLEAFDNLGQDLRSVEDQKLVPFVSDEFQIADRSLIKKSAVFLQPGKRSAREIDRLRVKVPMLLLKKEIPGIEIDQVMKHQNQWFKNGTFSIVVHSFGPLNVPYLDCMMSMEKIGPSLEPIVDWRDGITQKFRLYDHQGLEYKPQGLVGYNQPHAKKMNMRYQFIIPPTPIGPPSKLVVLDWVTMRHELVFEFRNLPLP